MGKPGRPRKIKTIDEAPIVDSAETKKMADELEHISKFQTKRKMNPNSLANLKPIDSPERARQLGRMHGGKQSGKVRARRALLKKYAADIMSNGLTDAQIKKLSKEWGMTEAEAREQSQLAMMVAGVAKAAAQRGDVRAFETIERLLPDDKSADDKQYHMDLYNVADAYHPMIRKIRKLCENAGECNEEFVLKGGRGSAKSSVAAMLLIEIIKNVPDINALVCRKIGNTLRDSVYNQILWALDMLGENMAYWDCKKTPLQITYLPTGQMIYFRGLDKPEKLKSLKPQKGYIGIIWFEEASQLFGNNEKRTIEQSMKRSKGKYFTFLTYNPPKSANNWINRYADEAREGKTVIHTTYKDVPEEWLGEAFLEDAKFLQEINPRAYANEYEGTANGSGANVFENLELREITDDEISKFEYRYFGNDWGFANDPNAFNAVCYDAKTMTLYIYDEKHAIHCSNEQWSEVIKEYDGEMISSDSAAPKDNAWFRDRGFRFRDVKKGPNSVEQGLRVMSNFAHIVIDPVRCPDTAKEFKSYEYMRDKDGEIIAAYPDKDNHHIDAVRYALADVIRNPRFR